MTLPKLLLTGRQGQLGLAFYENWEGMALSEHFDLVRVDRQEFDITDSTGVKTFLDELHPSVILNTAAYTRVDDAETNPEEAYRVNDLAVGSLASWCATNSCKLIHLSTDFVFSGSATMPYSVCAGTGPLGVYGASKLAGEGHVLGKLPSSGFVVRTSWLYSEYGHNFVTTMLRLMSGNRELSVVNDQIGSPTSVHSLCLFIAQLIGLESAAGIYHFTDGGSLSWYEFAVTIQEMGIELGMLPKNSLVNPVPTESYPTPAKRPAYSVLDISMSEEVTDRASRDWKRELLKVLKRIQAGSELEII